MRSENMNILIRSTKLRTATIAVMYQRFMRGYGSLGNPWKEARIETLYGTLFRKYFRGRPTSELTFEDADNFNEHFKENWLFNGILECGYSSEKETLNFQPAIAPPRNIEKVSEPVEALPDPTAQRDRENGFDRYMAGVDDALALNLGGKSDEEIASVRQYLCRAQLIKEMESVPAISEWLPENPKVEL